MYTIEAVILYSLISFFIGVAAGAIISWRYRSYKIRTWSPVVPAYNDDRFIRTVFILVILFLFSVVTLVGLFNTSIEVSPALTVAMTTAGGAVLGAEVFSRDRKGKNDAPSS